MSNIIVQKFGGTSVGSTNNIKNMVFFVESAINSGYSPIVVVSAMAGVTNNLITLCNELAQIDDGRKLAECDAALATGEIVSASLMALSLQQRGIKAQSLSAWQIPIVTNSDYGNAIIEYINSQFLLDLINKQIVPVISGFQAIDKNNRQTTLGRGGSDTSAAAIAAAIDANLCDIYSDVKGIYDADPRIIHEAKKIDKISHQEAVNFSENGAKILHCRAAQISMRHKLTMRVLNSFDKTDNYSLIDNNNGTLITEMKHIENSKITGITSKQNFCVIKARLENIKLGVLISTMSKEEINISFFISAKQENEIFFVAPRIYDVKISKLFKQFKLENKISNFSINTEITQISLVGYGLKNDMVIISKIHELLQKEDVEIFAMQIEDSSISIMIGLEQSERMIKLLYQTFLDRNF